MKRLPRVPVWLILLPLAALALTAWFGESAAQSFAATRVVRAAAVSPHSATAATPTASTSPQNQSSAACPSPGANQPAQHAWRDTPWGGLWFDLADIRYTAMRGCEHHGRDPSAWRDGQGGPPPWIHRHHGRDHQHFSFNWEWHG
ncbi:MAG TPA: hypothetical protein VFZ25_02830 [Chloroflexota bacterium]|nr:hypothetical protein [Chloroflexota bacterium]